MRQLNAKHRTLKSIEPRIQSDPFVVVTLFGTMNAKCEKLTCEFVIVSRHESAVAHSAKIL